MMREGCESVLSCEKELEDDPPWWRQFFALLSFSLALGRDVFPVRIGRNKGPGCRFHIQYSIVRRRNDVQQRVSFAIRIDSFCRLIITQNRDSLDQCLCPRRAES